jgi:hypothetical protein
VPERTRDAIMKKKSAFPIMLYIAHLHFLDYFLNISLSIEAAVSEKKNAVDRNKRYSLHVFGKLIVAGNPQTGFRPVFLKNFFDKASSRNHKNSKVTSISGIAEF